MKNLKQTNDIDITKISAHLIDSRLIPNKIILCARRSVAIIITDDGELVVRAPKNVMEKQIYDFLNEKANWIIKKRTETAREFRPKLKLDGSEEYISIMGTECKLILNSNIRIVKRIDNVIYVPTTNSILKLKSYLIKIFKAYVSERTKQLADLYKLKYKSITIRSSTTRWGSCGFNNTLNFTYKLIMCPTFVIDYIIIHELTHTIEKNHSSRFYKRVEAMMPAYRTAEKWLKTNKSIIHVI